MTIAHLRSRLAIKSCLPVDFKNTVFLAHYDITEEENLKGIRPVGNRYAVSFDGKDDYIEIPYHTKLDLTQWTVAAWIKPSSSATSGLRDILYRAPSTHITYQLEYDAANKKVNVWVEDSADTDYFVWSANNSVPYDVWTHVCASYDGTSLKLYINGSLVGTNNVSFTPSTGNSVLWIGRGDDGYFCGSIAEVQIWDHALSVDQIANLMNIHLLGNEFGLSGYWKLDEGKGNIALDTSVNNIHGYLKNGSTWSDGRYVTSLRPSEGKYGGCIAVEEGTTNLVKNGDFSQGGTNWRQENTGTVIDTDVSMPMFTKAVRMERYDSQHNMWYQDITGQPQQATYTLSQYIKLENYTSGKIGALIYFYYTDGTYTYSLTEVDYTKIGVWQYVTTTGTPNQEKTLSFIRVYAPWSNFLKGSFLCTGVQLEQKPYATSFVNGIRDKGILQYPLIIDPNNFTLNFWAKCTGNDPFHIDILVTTDDNNRVFFRPTNTTTINGGRVVNGTVSFIGDLNLINDITQWNMYTLVSEGSTMRIYQNGVKLGENQSILQLNSGSSYLVFNGDNKPRNALFDEVRIDRVPRTDTEIMEWYMSQTPFYPKGIHKKLL